MATYNGEQWLAQQLETIFAQRGCFVRLFVNDDGSTDETLRILKGHPRASEISVGAVAKGGAGQNFIHLLRSVDCADFDYVALSDQDDLWAVDKLERAVSHLEESGADAYSSNVTAFWPDGHCELIVKSQPVRQFDYMFESAGPGCTFVLKKDTAAALRQFLHRCPPDQLGRITLHDWLIYAWARHRGCHWLIDDFSGVRYRQHTSNVLGASRNSGGVRKRWQMISSGWYLDQARRNADLVGIENVPATLLRRRGLKDLFYTLPKWRELRRRPSEALILALVLLKSFFGAPRVASK